MTVITHARGIKTQRIKITIITTKITITIVIGNVKIITTAIATIIRMETEITITTTDGTATIIVGIGIATTIQTTQTIRIT